ncbi:MAG: hypothetical protein ACRCVD_08360, partial [Halioglobus sp.]
MSKPAGRAADVAADSPNQLDSPYRSALLRGACFFIFWLVLVQSLKLADMAVGAGATGAATWLSLRL